MTFRNQCSCAARQAPQSTGWGSDSLAALGCLSVIHDKIVPGGWKSPSGNWKRIGGDAPLPSVPSPFFLPPAAVALRLGPLNDLPGPFVGLFWPGCYFFDNAKFEHPLVNIDVRDFDLNHVSQPIA